MLLQEHDGVMWAGHGSPKCGRRPPVGWERVWGGNDPESRTEKAVLCSSLSVLL